MDSRQSEQLTSRRSFVLGGLAVGTGAMLGLVLANRVPLVVQAGDTNPPPFDFSDALYLQNGINPSAIQHRVGVDPNDSIQPEGPPVHSAPPGSWVFDNSNTDPNRQNVRILQTTGGFDKEGDLIYYSINGFVGSSTFTDDAAGQNAQAIANRFRAFLFPRDPNHTQVVCSPTVTTNCIKLDPGIGNRRQDNVFDTRQDYFENDPLGLWLLAFVVFTDQAFTPQGQTTLDNIAAQNVANGIAVSTGGRDLDGTPVLTAAEQIDGLVAQGLARILTREHASGIDPQGFPWVI